MKKILIFIFSMALCVTLAACNNNLAVNIGDNESSDRSTLSTTEPSETANENNVFTKSWDRRRAYGAPDMSADESEMWQQKLQTDIPGVTSYQVGEVYSKDFDVNGINDLMVLLYEADEQPFQAYLCVYMNDGPIYTETFSRTLTAFGFMQYPICGDIDNDGYPEIVYNIFTGGNGGAGSSVKGVLKYDKHELIPMDLPGDDSEDFTENNDVGYRVKVLFGKGENEYKAVCDGLGKTVDFKAQNAVNEDGTKFQPNNIIENGEAGANCRGYSGFSIVNRNGRNYLLAEEYLYGEAGISDGVGFATFLIQWDGSGKPFVSEFGVLDKSVLSAAESSAPESKTEVSAPGPSQPAQKGPAATAPEQEPGRSVTPAPGSKNEKGEIYDPAFGWITVPEGISIPMDNDGDINKQVGTMGE